MVEVDKDRGLQVNAIKLFPDIITDPRAEDFPEDSQLWMEMLETVRQRGETLDNAYLYGHLLFMRFMGTRLKASEKWGFIMEPVIGESGWQSREQYNKRRKVLDSYRQVVIELLGRLGFGSEFGGSG